ncbi:hypothetical protein [Emticicia sp. 21SJ11W-3]|uniref:hypothetical protein n=1 Tax=Emticicia sp. 21SJ11W-3 TaxID=2916755 RepID=UPI0020A00FB8|nr:hypothetical protein [Emticicia sp. 21SJ11W-3]UTA67144.1 hypothetical protein MB380_16240 [Emticicia sp. 21SJ11W-3]
MKTKVHRNLIAYVRKSIVFVLESGALAGVILLVILFFVARNCEAQVDFAGIPETEKFINNKAQITVKNVKYVQREDDIDCTWKTSHAVLDGMLDIRTQDFLNDWLSGMTAFGNCEGDKECYDFELYHYFYKSTRVSYLKNDFLGFYLHEGNCKTERSYCLENQDWEIYDLRGKRFLQESDIINQDEKSQKIFYSLIENRVKKLKQNLVSDWKAYTRQIGLDKNMLVVYLNNDMMNNTRGVLLKFRIEEIEKVLVPCFANRLNNRGCEKIAEAPGITQQFIKN